LHLLTKPLQVMHILSLNGPGTRTHGAPVLRRQAPPPPPASSGTTTTAEGTFDEINRGKPGQLPVA
jgi:hypothetical protein